MADRLRFGKTRQADGALSAQAAETILYGAGAGRSTPQRPGMSCSKISGSSIIRPRLPVQVSALGWLGHHSTSFSAPVSASMSASVVHSLAATSSRLASCRLLRIKPGYRHAAQNPLLHQGLHHVGRGLRQAEGEFIEEGVGDYATAGQGGQPLGQAHGSWRD